MKQTPDPRMSNVSVPAKVPNLSIICGGWSSRSNTYDSYYIFYISEIAKRKYLNVADLENSFDFLFGTSSCPAWFGKPPGTWAFTARASWTVVAAEVRNLNLRDAAF